MVGQQVASGDKRFGLLTPRDLLSKLLWEIECLADPSSSLEIESYRCFNAAVTAWHLTDWVWQAHHQNEYGTVAKFQEWVRRQSKELGICDQLANGSKHFERDPKWDRTDVFVKTEPSLVIIKPPSGALKFLTQPSLFVYDGDRMMGPSYLFGEAYTFWYSHLDKCENTNAAR
jgi:hypothetical protein